MDQTGAAFVEAVEPYGPIPLMLLGLGIAVLAVLCAYVLPAWRKNLESQQEIERIKAEAQIAIEQEREAREARNEERKAEENRTRAEIDGKTAVLIEGLKTSIDALVANQERVSAQIESSRTNSQKMGITVDDTNRKVNDLHRALMK